MKKIKLTGFLAAAAVLLVTACSANRESAAPGTTAAEIVAETVAETQTSAEAQSSDGSQYSFAVQTGGTEIGTYPDGSSPGYNGIRVKLTVDGEEVIIAMYDNTAAVAFLERLPMENLEFYDLSGIEKPANVSDEPFSIADEEPGYDPVAGEMVIYRPWGNFTIFYGDFRHSDELVPLGKVESGLEVLVGKADDFTGSMEIME
ncbi:hypothetical protein GPL15_24515 [Clostridium sp. MCC353]|uniref:cyclophilin-like fold protein n=1 Tax=Clostridium sp. MCC353 TaxID=2592646 RepID=UPI001C02B623|nr:cyclophilin-like fold protein [Clostridium sp. MCC353]MBT9779642.1 hypothetical protein [Clostridium sp. MCC353]